MKVLDSSKRAMRILDEFLDALELVQSEITDLDGASFGCFPFGYAPGNKTCATSDSPVCATCRALQSYLQTEGGKE